MSTLIWLPSEIATDWRHDADAHYPFESGGALMGYSVEDEIVVTASIPGGRDSKRRRYSFEPDLMWQNKAIAEHYHASDRKDEYLGDWHCHPDTVRPYLSGQDLRAAKKIIRSDLARNARPVMALLFGTKENWEICAWQCELIPRFHLFSTIEKKVLEVRFFDSVP